MKASLFVRLFLSKILTQKSQAFDKTLPPTFFIIQCMKLIIIFSLFYITSIQAKTILFLGDSLTEGYGIDKDSAYPVLLDKRFKEEGLKNIKIVNASISGSTSASAPSRFRWFLKSKPDILLLALGANDGLRGVNTESIYKNLATVIEKAQEKKIKVILCGIRMPPNYGEDYNKKFMKVFSDLASKYKLIFIPQLLEGIGGEKSLNIEDGIHPNEEGHKKIMNLVYPYIKKAL